MPKSSFAEALAREEPQDQLARAFKNVQRILHSHETSRFHVIQKSGVAIGTTVKETRGKKVSA